MKLKTKTLAELADMVTGGSGSLWVGSGSTNEEEHPFPYRSSSQLTEFFENLELDQAHDGSSRIPWTKSVLIELNEGATSKPELPADTLVAVVRELMDAGEFEKARKDRQGALARLNASLMREGLQAYFDESGVCQLRAGGTTSTGIARDAAWTQEELRKREAWKAYLNAASEDDFTEQVLMPLLRRCNFQRVSSAGHGDKALEYGKDLWMKFRLPTGHFIYFAIQVKKGKLDSASKTKGSNENVTEVLNQVRMALDHEVFDPDVNRTCLIDHIYIVATGEITKQARNLLVGRLDREKRRQVIFMDRGELLDLLARASLPLPATPLDDEIPF